MNWLFAIDMAGVIVVAVTGCLAAARKRLDLFGAVVFAILTGVGGGTLRDLLLDVPVFWIARPVYVIAAAATGLATFFWMRFLPVPHGTLRVADALALGFYTVIGAEKALANGAPPTIAVVMGLLTGVAGGAIRDVLSAETPMILGREIYATASLLGSTILVSLRAAGFDASWAWGCGFAAAFLLRLAAIRWHLRLPSAISREPADGGDGGDD
ncbi:MAG: trimeric intracellular cation channel family protein [Verrucomicrobiae bacterium]|nr:trimeric intracellular cation channel family protein [Verrucomicrobiae bacterium]